MFGTDTQKQMHMPKKFECSFKNLSKKMEKKEQVWIAPGKLKRSLCLQLTHIYLCRFHRYVNEDY